MDTKEIKITQSKYKGRETDLRAKIPVEMAAGLLEFLPIKATVEDTEKKIVLTIEKKRQGETPDV